MCPSRGLQIPYRFIGCLLIYFPLLEALVIPNFDKVSACGFVGSSYVELFNPCAPSEWEPLLTDTSSTMTKATNVTAVVALPATGNSLGCSPHTAGFFKGLIALIGRGTCTFVQKVLLAQQAGAAAVLLYDNVATTTIGLVSVSVSPPTQIPSIPAYLISRGQGTSMANNINMGATTRVFCSWRPIQVWFDAPAGTNLANDSLAITNRGDQTMYWQVRTRRFFALSDNLYTAALVSAPAAFSQGGAPGSTSSVAVTMFDGTSIVDDKAVSVRSPILLSHFLKPYSRFQVSSNGLLVFDPSFIAGSDASGVIGSTSAPNGFIAGLWDNLVCRYCKITAAQASGLDGVAVLAVRYEGLSFYKAGAIDSAGDGPITFEVWMYGDGRILLRMESFPNSITSRTSLKVGIEDTISSGAVLNVAVVNGTATTLSLPWTSGPFALALTPWFMPRSNFNASVAPLGSQTVNFTFSFAPVFSRSGWLQMYSSNVAFDTSATAKLQSVRFSQLSYRIFWSVSAWDGDLHTGSCAVNQTRSRTRTCIASDGSTFDDSVCINGKNQSCADTVTGWLDAWNTTCEDEMAWLSTPAGSGVAGKVETAVVGFCKKESLPKTSAQEVSHDVTATTSEFDSMTSGLKAEFSSPLGTGCNSSSSGIHLDKDGVLGDGQWYEDLDPYLAAMVDLRRELDEVLAFASRKMSVMVARYPGGGTHYARHFDSLPEHEEPRRRLTAVFYLNPDWLTEHGGCLRAYIPASIASLVPEAIELKSGLLSSGESEWAVDIEPRLDRLVLFASEWLEHEVLPSNAERHALTTFFY